MDSLDIVQIRLVPDKKLYSDTPITKAEDACSVLTEEMKQLDRETVAVLALNAQNQILSASFCSLGALNESIISPREIFKSCILQNASAFILFHNHPSGPAQIAEKYFLSNGKTYQSRVAPSEQDVLATKRMMACGELMGIRMLDHVIVAGYTGEYFSFMESGMLTQNELDEYLKVCNVSMSKEASQQEKKQIKQSRKRKKIWRLEIRERGMEGNIFCL